MTPIRTTTTRTLGAVAAMYAGLLLTLAATVAPYVDRVTGHVLADHIHHGYPRYTHERVDTAVDAWLGILTVVGVLGIVCWVGTIWAVKADKAWARPTATVMFVGGTALALAALLTKDTSGEVGLAPLLGWIGMLPPLAGLAAVILLWILPRRPGGGGRMVQAERELSAPR
jgi:hypothetical protein